MATPLKSKLSYIWSRVAGKKHLYTPVLTKRGTGAIESEFSNRVIGYHTLYYYEWMQAKPIKGMEDQYILEMCSYRRHKSWGVDNGRLFSQKRIRNKSGQSTYSYKEAREIMKYYAAIQQEKGWVIDNKQPFKKKMVKQESVSTPKSTEPALAS